MFEKCKDVNIKQTIKNISMNFLSMFKHKEQVDIVDNDKNHNYLTKKKMKMLGIKDIDMNKNVLIDKNDVRYKVIRLSLLEQNGLSAEVEESNRRKIIDISEKVWNKKKYIYTKEKRNNLDDNIKYYMDLNNHETRDIYKQSRQERIDEMQFYNKGENISLLMFLEDKDIDNTIQIYASAFCCEILDYDKMIVCLNMLVNDM